MARDKPKRKLDPYRYWQKDLRVIIQLQKLCDFQQKNGNIYRKLRFQIAIRGLEPDILFAAVLRKCDFVQRRREFDMIRGKAL